MYATIVIEILLLQFCELCFAIKVPINWSGSDNSAVNDEFSVESFLPPELKQTTPVPIPEEYFQYTAKKPAFAVDIAKFHNVQSPENLYHSYPIRPITGVQQPVLGKYEIADKNNPVFDQFQKYVDTNDELKSQVTPFSSSYEVFHPYKAEEPALAEIYKDPVLDKIRGDLRNAKNRLQKYENDAGESNISQDEYLESPDETDKKLFQQPHAPAPYEDHRPQRQPFYYSRNPARHTYRHNHLNKRFKHPLYQTYAKIKPEHYKPLKDHLHHFHHNQALKYDDEQNEYPQLPPPQNFAEPVDGYDIYEKGKEKYVKLRDNVDLAINKAVKENRPATYGKLELQNNGNTYSTPYKYTEPSDSSDDEEEGDDEDDTTEFVPIKNYAQVRRTTTTKHLPRSAALDEATNFEELKNAPRLREAVKTNKAQVVYSEEGYEDSAYDHAGEQKHASDHEGHGGFLKEHEISGGHYRIPSVNAAYSDGSGSNYGDTTLHGEKWKNDDKDSNEENRSEDYSDDDHDKLINADVFDETSASRDKREHKNGPEASEDTADDEEVADENSEKNDYDDVESPDEDNSDHEVNKREAEFDVPDINLNKTFLPEKELKSPEMTQKIVQPEPIKEHDELKEKYPYYFINLGALPKDSPLRYSENLRFMPRKSKGGTEFYDSRSDLVCPEVDDEVDPIPEKIKNNSTGTDESDDNSEDDELQKRKKRETEQDPTKNKQRLKGLGDKIDCFKAKYFGENPLDSPFFKEDLILNPEPVTLPNLPTYKFKESKKLLPLNDAFNISEKIREENKNEFGKLFQKLSQNKNKFHDPLLDPSNRYSSILTNANNTFSDRLTQQSGVYTDILDNIKVQFQRPLLNDRISHHLLSNNFTPINKTNITYNVFSSKEDVMKRPTRKRRAALFVYEPYKRVRDAQVQETKKISTTKNLSPLIRQLQSSRVVETFVKSKSQPVKRNVSTRTYKDIGRQDRAKNEEAKTSPSSRFVDVSVDKRRGEPRYEIKPNNHKEEYTPIDSKKAMSVEEYEAQSKPKSEEKLRTVPIRRIRSTTETPTPRPFFDVSQFIPKPAEVQKQAASRTVHRIVRTTTPAIKQISKNNESQKRQVDNRQENDDEDYEEYDSEEEEEEEVSKTTTTTTRPHVRRRAQRVTTTTSTTTTTPLPSTLPPRRRNPKIDPGPTKLQLTTRFNEPSPAVKQRIRQEKEKSVAPTEQTTVLPKFREKSKKSSKSTLVTDTKSYGDDNNQEDDMRKDEVDAMIGVKQDIKEYMPRYEKEVENVDKNRQIIQDAEEQDDEDDEDYDDDDDDDEDDDEDDEDDDEEEEEEEEEVPEATSTTENPKRTLPKTTEAPVSTTETRSAQLQAKPLVVRKKVVIHKELPADKTSPHVSQYKQDIKEVEIIKEIPQKKLRKNTEALDLYKDDKLAKEVNKLGDVEIFKQNLDLKTSPRHGGNYRSAQLTELTDTETPKPIPLHGGNLKSRRPKEEVPEKKSTKNAKLQEISEVNTNPPLRLHGGNLRAKKVDPDNSESEHVKVVQYNTDDDIPARNDKKQKKFRSKQGRSEELVELSDVPASRAMHGGNLKKYISPNKRGEARNAKIIEFEDEAEEEADEDLDAQMHGGNFKALDSRARSYGGNYRNAQLQSDYATGSDSDIIAKSKTDIHDPISAAQLLNSFAQAVPILTTTPAYILDPSKRKYFYVDV